MHTIHTQHDYRIDLNHCPLTEELQLPLGHQDALADCFTIAVRRGEEPVDVTGMSVYGYMYYHATRQTLPLYGYTEDNTANLILPDEAYATPGLFSLVIQLGDGSARHTLLRVNGEIRHSISDELLSSGEVLPPLATLLDEIDAMQLATANCLAVTREAKDAIAEAPSAVICEATGETIVVTDAANRRALDLLTSIRFQQEGQGDPYPTNVRPITSCDVIGLFHDGEDLSDEPIVTHQLPETLYAGDLNWNTGVLTVTHKAITLDGAFTEYGLASTGVPYVRFQLPEKILHLDAACSHYRISSSVPATAAVRLMTSNSVAFVYDERFTSRDAAAEILNAERPTLVYALAAPETEYLDPVEITLHHGVNTIECSPGESYLRYIADLKLYIDHAIAQATQG